MAFDAPICSRAVTFKKNQVKTDIEYQALYLNIYGGPPPPKNTTLTEIQSQMHYVTRGNKQDLSLSSLFETGYQLNQYRVPQCMSQN